MATEVLRPHNVLLQPHAHRICSTHRRANYPGATRKSSSPASTAGRGSSTSKKTASARHAVVEVYAGPAYSVSPEPSSLPLPQFTTFRKAAVGEDVAAATRDLRRMLRLE